MSKIKLSKEFIKSTVKLALNEDLFPSGDITSSLINNDKVVNVKLISNQNAIVGGLLFAKQAFALIDSKIKFIIKKKDGSSVKKGSLVASIKGKAKNILIAKFRKLLISVAICTPWGPILAKKLIVWLKTNPKKINTISACVLIVIALFISITQQY